MEIVLISLDVGSSGIRASAFTPSGRLAAVGKSKYPTIYRREGWAEQDPLQWESAAIDALKSMTDSLGNAKYEIKGLALTGQCPTYLPVDRDIMPLGMAYTYQDNRSVSESEELVKRFGNEYIHHFSGHSVQPFYILPKILWQKTHEPGIYDRIYKVLQPSDYIAYLLTGELATDTAHANATLAYDLNTGKWNKDFLMQLDLKEDLFPQRVLNPWEIVGQVGGSISERTGLPNGLPVVKGAPDSQCCCFGVGAVSPDILSNMSGTSTCLNSTVASPVTDLRVGNYAHVIRDMWCTEVGLNTTGAALDWFSSLLYKGMNDREKYTMIRQKSEHAPAGSNGLLFFPYLTGGERDNQSVKGGFHNMNIGHTDAELIRAVMEGVAFAERERVDILTASGCSFSGMRISGGGASIDSWCQMKADVMNLPVSALKNIDAAELGAAMVAGVGTGVFSDFGQAVQVCRPQHTEFTPDPQNAGIYEILYHGFLQIESKLGK